MSARSTQDEKFMRLALRLARKATGFTSPNPLVGAVLVKGGKILGRGWHHRAGQPHAEIEALRDAERRGLSAKGATLYVTLEPCSTHGRTPPCCDAIRAAQIKRVVVAATDPNHAGRGFALLRDAGITVEHGLLADEAARLNGAFNHWIVHHTPLVTVKAAMTLDGKIATASGGSKWITGEESRAWAMNLRLATDAILVGVNTILADDPSLTFRKGGARNAELGKKLRRIVLDSTARTPLNAKVVSDASAALTTIIVTKRAPKRRTDLLLKRGVNILVAPERRGRIDLRWLLRRLGKEQVTNLLVEGGGEVNASFLETGLAHRVAFFYAPKILGGRDSRRAVAGEGAKSLKEVLLLTDIQWRKLGNDLLLLAKVGSPPA
jgi:diaminohydroxyphosphoribosylaminopyrimidine deaminase/5-amino-6-(5-phosphoribosylamino)uracil reductase